VPEHRFAVVEMGMRGLGQIAYLRGLAEPDVAVVVNAGSAHVGLLGSTERIRQAKSEIWLDLPAGGRAILPAGDAALAAWLARRGVAGERVLRFGEAEDADVRVAVVEPAGEAGSDVTFVLNGAAAQAGRGRRFAVRLPLPGRHNATNAACALAVAVALGIDPELAVSGLGRVAPVAHRSAVRTIGGRHVYDDCYNANPASMAAAIATVAELTQRAPVAPTAGAARATPESAAFAPAAAAPASPRFLAVVGDMLELGDEGAAAHREHGRALGGAGAAHVVALGAQADEIAAGLAQTAPQAPCERAADPVAAAQKLARASRPGDWILVKASRGMRLERVIDALIMELG
jgi:UDP-N-acetylmuramyl pentapeptide synthase